MRKIAFGSCISQNHPQYIWYKVAEQAPDIFIFCGDNIYGDTYDMQLLRQKYDMLGNKPGYRTLKKNTRIIATWDDHDYGKNDAGKEYRMKAESKKEFLRFFEEPDTSSRWSHEGIYHSYFFGETGKLLQIIVLDTRTFRDKLLRVRADTDCKGPYAKTPGKHKTFLGEEQWAWLEKELSKPADLRIIVSSTQFLVEFNGWEAWINMPHERERMMQLIEKTRANGVIFISGDVHYAELSRLKRQSCYPLYDLTSSGMTHGHPCDGGNIHRLHNYIYMKPNYGLITIDWEQRNVRLEIKDEQNNSPFHHTVPFSEISF
ncbi:MAG: alkaline phosphatase family protein [Chitinophagales bacterium]|nr:alkaline phosphatase family protein [Chitinophagales bacterium]MDW8418282.1 alkaline phosphatase D family protein [Chitinophagales bacterium]